MSARGDDRKAEILDAATARIVAHGFEGLRIRDVANDVGINNATLHHHFPTKADLISALVRRFKEGFSLAGGVPADGTLDERLAAYVAIRQDQMRSKPAPFAVLSELLVLARRDAEVCKLVIELEKIWIDYLVAFCMEGGADPDTALARANRCRRELIGMSIDCGIGWLDRPQTI